MAKPAITITDCLHAFALAEPFVPKELGDKAAMACQQGIAMGILDWAAIECSEQRARFDMEAQHDSKLPVFPAEPKRK